MFRGIDYTFHGMTLNRASRTDRVSRRPVSTVGFLLAPGFALMSYASAVEPLRAANTLAGRTLYRWWHATPGNAPALASNGAAVLPDVAFGAESAPPDLVLACAGGNPAAFDDRATFAWLRRLARKGTVIGGISGGPFIVARAGLLAGRRCTIHWEHIPAFQEAFPDTVLTGSLFEIDGDRITCSGGIAGLDMMLELIARDHGRELASAVGDWFLHTHVREGIGPQRMDLRFRLGVADDRLLAVLAAMEANLETPLARTRLAAIAGLSLRQLERAFRRQLRRSLHRHYLALRLDRARQLLRETSLPILDVAVATGFGSASQFARAFRRAFAAAPRQLRTR
jgi:transcriptional regulator GlxA family with amidase domain